MKFKTISIISAALLLLFIGGCSQKLDKAEISKYADSVTENMLLAQNTDDYTKYIENVDKQFKEAISEDKMKEVNKIIKDKIGTYGSDSKKFKDAVKTTQNKEKYVVVRYNGKFTNESGDVLITMVFHDNDLHEVTGIFFNSPKLREK